MDNNEKFNAPKKRISKILEEDRGWHDVKDSLPTDISRPVVIRFMTNQYCYYETDTEIYYMEDIKLAMCIKDYNNPDDINKCSWSIIPPYPKFDYSPLSNFDKIKEGSVVTHWAEASDEDIKEWNNRFNITDAYLTLRFDVDDDHAELMYRALMYGLGSIGKAYTREKSDELLAFHIVMQDLINSIDKNIMIENGKEISKSTDYDPAEEDGGDKAEQELAEILSSVNKSSGKTYIRADIVKAINELISQLISILNKEDTKYIENLFMIFFNKIGISADEVPYFQKDPFEKDKKGVKS